MNSLDTQAYFRQLSLCQTLHRCRFVFLCILSSLPASLHLCSPCVPSVKTAQTLSTSPLPGISLCTQHNTLLVTRKPLCHCEQDPAKSIQGQAGLILEKFSPKQEQHSQVTVVLIKGNLLEGTCQAVADAGAHPGAPQKAMADTTHEAGT